MRLRRKHPCCVPVFSAGSREILADEMRWICVWRSKGHAIHVRLIQACAVYATPTRLYRKYNFNNLSMLPPYCRRIRNKQKIVRNNVYLHTGDLHRPKTKRKWKTKNKFTQNVVISYGSELTIRTICMCCVHSTVGFVGPFDELKCIQMLAFTLIL